MLLSANGCPAASHHAPPGQVTHPMCGISRETDLVLKSTKREVRRAFWTHSRTNHAFLFPLCLFLSYRSQMYLPPAITQSRKEEKEPNSLYASASGRSTLVSKFLQTWTTNYSEDLAFFRHVFFEFTEQNKQPSRIEF